VQVCRDYERKRIVAFEIDAGTFNARFPRRHVAIAAIKNGIAHEHDRLTNTIRCNIRYQFIERLSGEHREQIGVFVKAHLLRRDRSQRVHAAASRSGAANALGTGLPSFLAKALTPSIRHFGMECDVFQLDTVVGAMSRKLATATVPPSSSIKSDTVFMPLLLRDS